MTIRHYVATVHLLIELDDSVAGMSNCQAAACDAVSEHLRNCEPEIKDWAYARTAVPVPQALDHPDSDSRWASPVEIECPMGGVDDDPSEYEEGAFLEVLPQSHRIAGGGEG